jgi:hypothetical protein
MKLTHAFPLALLLFTSPAVKSAEYSPTEHFPKQLIQELKEFREGNTALLSNLPPGVASYIIVKSTWPGPAPITVAFLGGDLDLRRKVIAAARVWERPGQNRIKFDFGDEQQGFRSWSPLDSTYSADIRIAFGQQYVGYWSAVGIEARNPNGPFLPGVESMNFEGFLIQEPDNLVAVVIHEFGHALGFRHEHQQSVCADELRWIDEGVGKPSVYTYYALNHGWDQQMTEWNLRPYLKTEGDRLSAHDPESVMHYALPAEVFLDPNNAECLVEEKAEPSVADFAGAAIAYRPASTPASNDDEAVAAIRSARETLTAGSALDHFLAAQEALISR